MSYETFDFPYHSVRHRYPAGDSIQFGGGYVFAAEPAVPTQRTFILKFNALRIYRVAGVLSDTVNAQTNLLALDKFYNNHLLWKRFNYVHEQFGTLVCRFLEPFEMPEIIPGGLGVSKDFELTIIEQPE